MVERDNWQRRYRMVYATGGRHVVADEPELLLDVLIDGYLELPEDLRQWSRVAHAGQIRSRLQQRVLAAYGPSGLTPDEQRDFLDDPEPTQVPSSWSADVPLILVDAHFADGPRPERAAGRIVWLETTDDDGYLRSLATAGEILLMIRQDEAAGAEHPQSAAGQPAGRA
ncbi:hypothetical protein [Micromonospora sp. NBC_01813]|uniref:hypothetical protein n=1 Tax=Micromonospora sp. NBC_01813 TaxID=2975988 RepID=UPI002DDA89D6|nr:hypothetical protein [Micromonospora sp. NBC_01813]WSA07716.1 hypothetical protein OG958_26355 [Micromonospora sp. NBC_01813]